MTKHFFGDQSMVGDLFLEQSSGLIRIKIKNLFHYSSRKNLKTDSKCLFSITELYTNRKSRTKEMKQTTQFLFSIILCTGIISSCERSNTQHRTFDGIYADDPHGKEGLYNPERGFRLETALDVTEKNYIWNPKEYPDITSYLEKESLHYASDSVSLVQTYFYLTGAVGKSLTEEDFETMAVFFDSLRSLGKKAVLRFAYETNFMGRAPIGPILEDIVRHTEQLKPFLEKNKDVIQVVQAGMIGAWGEWHSSVHGLERSDSVKRIVLQHICKMVPENRAIQIRVPAYKNLLDSASSDYRRVSFHDDFIVIDQHRWDGGMSEGTPAFAQIVRESPFLPVDGELPWGTWSVNQDADNPDDCWLVDGLKTARQLFLQHYTSLSAIHNYKESRGGNQKYSMIYWKETPITETFLKENRMPVSDGYFRNRDGSIAERSVFDYIRDHLGYRIELQEMTAPKTVTPESRAPIEVTLINRGFSTLFNEHPVYFVLIDESDNVCNEIPTSARVNDWQPYRPEDSLRTPSLHRIQADLQLPDSLPEGIYRIGLWIPDGSERLKYNARFAIRCANSNTPWWISPDRRYGVNLLGTLQKSPK